MSDHNESRPQENPEAAKSFGGDIPQYTAPIDIVALGAHEWHLFMDGWESGYSDGIERGRKIADDEAAARHRAAAEIVLAMSKIPERDRDADRAAAERRNKRFGGGQ